jgi:hypothetical protein
MSAREALGPLQFRFTDDEDREKYGDRWFKYAEADIMRMRAKDLIQLETELGMVMVDVMNGMRASTTLGDMAGAWIGVRAADPALAGAFDDFNPVVMAIEWRAWNAEDTGGKAPAGDGTPDGAPPSSATSDQTDTVILQNLPIAG